jgi:hypothetical protein
MPAHPFMQATRGAGAPEKLSLQDCAIVCSSSTACPQAALISAQDTGCSGVRPSRKPLMVPKGPSCQMRNVSLSTLDDCAWTHVLCGCVVWWGGGGGAEVGRQCIAPPHLTRGVAVSPLQAARLAARHDPDCRHDHHLQLQTTQDNQLTTNHACLLLKPSQPPRIAFAPQR